MDFYFGLVCASLLSLAICDTTTTTTATTTTITRTTADVNCGAHYAATCQYCPQGHGASWCNGECVWENNQCTSADVNCGAHHAATCQDCPQGHGASWCNGECIWDVWTNQCTSVQWSGMHTKIWGDDECKHLGNFGNLNFGLADCKKKCLEIATCTAINYDKVSKDCVLRGCTQPVQPPQWQHGDYRGFHVIG